MSDEDRLVSVIPIHYSNALSPNIHIHQFPLLTRPLQVPPSALASGKSIRARVKSKSSRIEVHVPVDTRPEVYNRDKGIELGQARAQDDQENSQEPKKPKSKEPVEHRFNEVRLRSEQVPHRGVYMLGVLRDGRLHLHPVSQIHQLRPSLTYLDVLMRKTTKRSRTGDGSDSESDEAPLDPDEPARPPSPKKEKKPPGDSKEVTVAVRKAEEKGAQYVQGGISGVRREMLQIVRDEEEEKWQDVDYCDGETHEAMDAFEAVFSKTEDQLETKSSLSDYLRDIKGL
ncbi:hypothetical protein BD410DRAFT_780909, partial [Rickenella mellea]